MTNLKMYILPFFTLLLLAGCQESQVDIESPNIPESEHKVTQIDTHPPKPEPVEEVKEIDKFFPVWVEKNRLAVYEEYGDPYGVMSSNITRYKMEYHHLPKRNYITNFLFSIHRNEPTPPEKDYVSKVSIIYNPVISVLDYEATSQNGPQPTETTNNYPTLTVDELVSDEFLSRKPRYIAGLIGPHDYNRYILVPIWEIDDNYYLILQIYLPHYKIWLEETEYDVETGKQTQVRKVNLSDDDGIYRFGECLVLNYYQYNQEEFWNYGNSKILTDFFIEE